LVGGLLTMGIPAVAERLDEVPQTAHEQMLIGWPQMIPLM